MDEAGDLGFSSHASRSHVIGYVIAMASDHHFMRNKSSRLLRKINQNLRPKQKISEFKFTKDFHETRVQFLQLINSFSMIDAGAVAIRKDSVKKDLHDNPVVLYNYLAVNYVVPVLVGSYLKQFMPLNRIKFKIDRSLSKADRARFNDYFDSKISWIKRQLDFKNDIFAEIDHENSQNDVCLQVADYVAGAVFRMIEHDDRQYYELIKGKIKHKQKWDWNEKISW